MGRTRAPSSPSNVMGLVSPASPASSASGGTKRMTVPASPQSTCTPPRNGAGRDRPGSSSEAHVRLDDTPRARSASIMSAESRDTSPPRTSPGHRRGPRAPGSGWSATWSPAPRRSRRAERRRAGTECVGASHTSPGPLPGRKALPGWALALGRSALAFAAAFFALAFALALCAFLRLTWPALWPASAASMAPPSERQVLHELLECGVALRALRQAPERRGGGHSDRRKAGEGHASGARASWRARGWRPWRPWRAVCLHQRLDGHVDARLLQERLDDGSRRALRSLRLQSVADAPVDKPGGEQRTG